MRRLAVVSALASALLCGQAWGFVPQVSHVSTGDCSGLLEMARAGSRRLPLLMGSVNRLD